MSRVLLDPRHHMTLPLSGLKELRDHSRFSSAHSRDPIKVPLKCVFHKRCRAGRAQHQLACCFPPHSEPMLQKCQQLSSSVQHPQIPASSISPVSSTAATVAVDGAPSTAWTFLSFASARRFRQSAHLWPFLPVWRHSPSNLAGLFLSVVLFDIPLLLPLPLA